MCSTSVAITAVVSCAVSFITGALVGAVVYYCTVRKKSNCQKCYLIRKAQKLQKQQEQQGQQGQQGQQPVPEYEEIIELRKNAAYGPIQQQIN